MMDYKELIALSRKAANEWRNDHAFYQAGILIDSLCSAIETLLAERDAAVEDLRFVSDCTSCKYYPFDDSCEACLECSCENENVAWEWRGPQKGEAHEP